MGPKAVKVLGVINSSKDLEGTGVTAIEREYSSNGHKIIKILVQGVEDKKYNMIYFYLKPESRKSRNGKMRYIDSQGNISHYVYDPKELGETFDDPLPLMEGEESLYRFLKILTMYVPYEGSTWRKELWNFGCSTMNLFRGNTKGLNELIKLFSTNYVGILVTMNGEYERVETDPETFFYTDGDVPPWYKDRIKALLHSPYKKIYGELDISTLT